MRDLSTPSYEALATANMPDLASLLQHSAVLAAWFDPQDRLCQANPAFLSAYHGRLGMTWAELLRDNHTHRRGVILSTDDFEPWLVAAQSRRGSVPFRAFESDLHDGRWVWMTETRQPDGSMLCIATDISQLKASEHALRHARDLAVAAANTDTLTGIGNRRYVLAQLGQLLDNLLHPGDQLSVVMADLDHFKRINDELGHPAGDTILQDFAHRSRHALRATDVVGRVGGEEFMLLLPALNVKQAESVVARLHAEVRQARPLPSRPESGYTFSAGITDVCAGDSLEQVFRRADQALYEAKAVGRNCTVCVAPR